MLASSRTVAEPKETLLMEIKVGVVYTAKELRVETDGNVDAAVTSIEEALKKGDAVVWFNDVSGRRIGIPSDKIAYIEVAENDENKRVGFGRG